MKRLRALFERRALDRVFAVMETPSAAITEFAARYGEGYCSYPDIAERFAFWDAHLRRRAAIADDAVPSAYLTECDQGLYGGMLGGDVQYMADPNTGWISSMVPPLLSDWSELDALMIDIDHEIFQRFRRQLETFVAGAAGRFGISHFILIDSLNLVFEFFGATKTYMALYEAPELVRRAIDFAFELNVMVQEAFFAADVLVGGGTCSNMVEWIPGRVVSESIDPFHMTSVADFERWGREPVERILGHFDGGVIHIHGNGRHLVEAASTIHGLKGVYLGDDKGFASAFDVLSEMRGRVGAMPLILACEFDEFVSALRSHTLTGGVLYRITGAPDAATANRTMEVVRAYRC